MTLPRSLQSSLDEADRIVAVIEGQTPTGETPTAPQPQPQPQAVAPQPPQAPQVQPEDTWKHKYDTLNGIFKAEKQRLEGVVGQLGEQVQGLVNRTQQLEVQLQRPEPVKPVARNITDADRETFGTELVDLIERAAPAVDLSVVEQALRRIEQLEGKVGNVEQTQFVSAKDQFWKNLTKLVPDWQAINISDDWKLWLLEVDPLYGMNRQTALEAAFGKLDAEHVATIFQTFTSLQPAPALTPQQELQRQVTPTRSHASNELPQSNQGMLWTNASIEAFYKDKRKGLLTEAQAAAYEEDLNRAAAEGRIQP